MAASSIKETEFEYLDSNGISTKHIALVAYNSIASNFITVYIFTIDIPKW